MSIEGLKIGASGEASAEELVRLASEYRKAAGLLRPQGRRGKKLSYYPFRLAAIQSVELYLSAYLVKKGHDLSEIEKLRHNLQERGDRALEHGLDLQKRTPKLLCRMTKDGDYLAARYRPHGTMKTQINELEAILEEIAEKVTPKVLK